MLISLLEVCLTIEGEIRIVGTGNIVAYSKFSTKALLEKKLREDLQLALEKKGWSEKDIEKKVGGVVFATEKVLSWGGEQWYNLLKGEWNIKYSKGKR